jgi:hypothetical protein
VRSAPKVVAGVEVKPVASAFVSPMNDTDYYLCTVVRPDGEPVLLCGELRAAIQQLRASDAQQHNGTEL